MFSKVAGHLRVDAAARIDLAIAVVTSIIVWIAFTVGGSKYSAEASIIEAFLHGATQWDGQWYLRIVAEGYSFRSDLESSAAFFPLYPLLVQPLALVVDARLAALMVSNGCFLASMVLLGKYVRERYVAQPYLLSHLAVLICASFPASFFFRAAYSESLLLLLMAMFLLGSQRRWNWWALVAITALATAARSVGVALIIPLAMDLFARKQAPARLLSDFMVGMPCAVSGLLAFVLYLHLVFGEPLAFVKAQQLWKAREVGSVTDKAIALVTLEPIWSVYCADCPCYWRKFDQRSPLMFCLTAMNPVVFILGVMGIAGGYAWRWLSLAETILAAQLLIIPYVMRGYETCMSSQGRFVAIVIPLHFVLALLLIRVPWPTRALVFALLGLYLTVLSCLFAVQYLLI